MDTDSTADATAVRATPQEPHAPAQLRAGRAPSPYQATGNFASRVALKGRSPARNSVTTETEFRELMEEPPGGRNAGRAASPDPNVEGRWLPLGVEDAQAYEFVRGGGWTLVDTSRGSHAHGAVEAGMSAHRGVLRGDEYVDPAALLAAVEVELGFTVEDVRAVYRQGRLSDEQREQRGKIDARLLALSRSGANMMLLAKLLGLTGPAGTWPRPLKNAIARAKAAELQNEGSQ